MEIEKYTPTTISSLLDSNDKAYVEYSEYEKLDESYDILWDLTIDTRQMVNEYVDLFEKMLDYYKVGGYEHGETVRSEEHTSELQSQ